MYLGWLQSIINTRAKNFINYLVRAIMPGYTKSSGGCTWIAKAMFPKVSLLLDILKHIYFASLEVGQYCTQKTVECLISK